MIKFYAENILLGGGVGNDQRVIKIHESALAFFGQNADHSEIFSFDFYFFVQSVRIAEQFIFHFITQNRHVAFAFDFLVFKNSALLGLDIIYSGKIGRDAVNSGPIAFIAVNDAFAAKNNRNDFFGVRNIRFFAQYFQIFFFQRICKQRHNIRKSGGMPAGRNADGF